MNNSSESVPIESKHTSDKQSDYKSNIIQGVIYPVSHRSWRIKFWALRTNCETQSKKVRIKKKSSAKRCNRCIALDSQQLARSQSPARSAGNCWCRHGAARRPSWTRVDVEWLTADNAQPPDLSAHSFRDSSTGRSTWWGRVFAFEDFREMAVNLSTVSKWKKELDVLGEWLHYDEATVRYGSHPLPFVLELGSPSSHQKLQHPARSCMASPEARSKKTTLSSIRNRTYTRRPRFSWATADENDKRNLEEHAHRESRIFFFVRGEGSRQPLVWGGVHDLKGGDALHQVSCNRGAWQEARRLPRTNISHGAQVSRIREHYWRDDERRTRWGSEELQVHVRVDGRVDGQ